MLDITWQQCWVLHGSNAEYYMAAMLGSKLPEGLCRMVCPDVLSQHYLCLVLKIFNLRGILEAANVCRRYSMSYNAGGV